VNTRGERWWLRSACVLLLLCSAAAPARAESGEYRTFEVESLRVDFDSEWAARTAPGYLPVRVDITNLGEARVLEIIGQSSRYFRAARGMQVGGTDLQQVVRLGRGDRVRLTIPMPIFGDSENLRFVLQEDGRTIYTLSYMSLQSAAGPSAAAALIVADPASTFGAFAATWVRPISALATRGGMMVMGGPTARPSGGSGMPPVDFVLPPGRLPTNWLGYTSLRAVFIGPVEWEQLSDAQKSALLTWTACGGDLFFVDGELPALFPGGRHPAAAAGAAAGATAGDRAPRGYFFGRIHRPTAASVAAVGLQDVLTEAGKVQDGDWSLPANGARFWGVMAARGFRLQIPGIDGVPARAYVSILVVFSLLIGPVNYWLLKRRRQQVLLVLTAPLISAVFIVLLGGYVLAGEGLGVRGRAVTFTMLDQVRNQASTRSSASLYAAGMAPSGGLRFSRDVAVFAIGPDGTGSRGRQELDLTDAQRYSSGVMQARSPVNIEQIAFRTARERLSFSPEGGKMTVVNGLGATVTALSYREGDKVYTLPRPLPPGSKATLEIGTRAAASVLPADVPQASRFVHLFEHQPAGSYLAVLERSPFWEPGLPDVIERGSLHVVIGWPEGQP
jgi:hypothetical protein